MTKVQTIYYRPLARTERARPKGAQTLADGWSWFSEVEVLSRDGSQGIVGVDAVGPSVLTALTGKKAPLCGLSLDQPRIMGVLNVTPDSFSDGGLFEQKDAAVARAFEMARDGADIIDIGGESTRPGADFVDGPDETSRTSPVIEALRRRGHAGVLSIDTRKASVARSALDAGVNLFNDVTALSFDPESLSVAAEAGAYVCLMHASGDPKTMQDNPSYENVLLDVYDYLETRVQACLKAEIPKDRIIVDPGIGFGKTLDHNLTLIRGLSLFHGLGCAILLGVSRKRFIGTLGDEPIPAKRAPGSIAIALEGARQGIQLFRVHDIAETQQALKLWRAAL